MRPGVGGIDDEAVGQRQAREAPVVAGNRARPKARVVDAEMDDLYPLALDAVIEQRAPLRRMTA